MLNNFFRINLPYGIAKNDKDEWMAFNREYMPLGFNSELSQQNYTALPIHTRYKGLTDKILLELAHNKEGIQKNEDGDIIKVFFYNDRSNPVNQSSDIKELWDDYFSKLKKLSKFERIG